MLIKETVKSYITVKVILNKILIIENQITDPS
jgi:hypothetical protein